MRQLQVKNAIPAKMGNEKLKVKRLGTRHTVLVTLLSLFSFLITFPVFAQSPGGISTNLNLWLKSDAGITESSGDVSAWADQSGSAYNFTDAGTSPYAFVSNSINFNPSIDNIDGTDRRLQNATSINLQTVAIVTNPDSPDNCDNPFSEVGADDEGIRACTSTGAAFTVPGGASDFTDTSGQGWFNGTLGTDPAHGNSTNILVVEAPALATIAGGVELGDTESSQYWHGSIAEVIGYGGTLSSTDRDKVESYLAIKYGVTLGHDYFASDGTVIRSLGGTYDYHIAGIGRDDASGLNQKQTQSTAAGSVVAIALGSYATDNVSNSNAFDGDIDFFTWADDNAGTDIVTAFSGADANLRMGRVWKIKEVNGVGTVEVRIPTSFGATYLVIDDNNGFTTPTELALSDNGDGTWGTTFDFTNGDFFSFGKAVPAPGGVIADLQLWIKANSGVAESAGDVNTWTDQSINSNDASQGTGANQPDLVSDALNYNPGLLFDGSDDYLDIGLSIAASAMPDLTVFSVHMPAIAAGGAPWGEDDGSWGRAIYNNSGTGALVGDGSGAGFIADLFPTNVASIASVVYDEDAASGSFVYGDGTLLHTFSANQDPGTSNNLDIGSKGDDGAGGLTFNGHILEVIVHANILSTQDREEVESYLALKYGITLSHDYFASDGTNLWDQATFGTYNNSVAGIGRDDVSDLDQRQSTAGDVVEIGNGSLASDNASNGNAFGSDLSFMMWGHDNAATTLTSTIAGTSINVHMDRIWAISETGTVGTVEVRIPDTFGITHLISDDNTGFSSPSETALSDNGDGTWSATINFVDGDFFSFGAFAQAPAGAVANLQLWLRSDMGTNTTSDGGAITSWADQSLNGLDAGTGAGTVTFESDAAKLVNYQPVVEFNGTVDRLNGGNLNMDDDTSVSAFYVLIDQGSTDNHTAFTFSGHDSDHRLEFDDDKWGVWDENTLTMGAAPAGSGTTWSVITEHYDGTTASVYANGVLGTAEARTNGIDLDGGSFYTIGASTTTSDGAVFDIVEVIVYTDAMTADIERIQSYLGIKYGTHMAHDYTSAGGTMLWDATVNATYHNDVAGIGRDDASGLDQKQSMGDILAAGLTAIAADNASNGNSFSGDEIFLLWGHDSGALSESTVSFGVNDAQLLNRKWLVAEIGDAGVLELQFDTTPATVTGTTASDFWVVADTDTDPTNGNRFMVQANSFSAGIASFTGIDLQDGDILMLVTDNPGDVTLPVELTVFDAVFDNGRIELSWTTASETNNAGFEIQRRVESPNGEVQWREVVFVTGRGNSEAEMHYSYSDDVRNVRGNAVAYRLKQVDFNGSFKMSQVSEIMLPAPESYDLASYPNPFNPVATIEYDVPVEGHIKVLVYDAQGREVAMLVDETQVAGRYRVSFDATGLASGIYVYRLDAGGKSFSKTMLLVK